LSSRLDVVGTARVSLMDDDLLDLLALGALQGG
jgi:hypothetical protein